jgi:aspartokinase/homoserine dehydrogenase 1
MELQSIDVFLYGLGIVGGELLEQIQQQKATLLSQSIDIHVCLIANSRRALFDKNGLDLSSWRESLMQSSLVSSIDLAIENLRAGSFKCPVFVDCTASMVPVARYLDLFKAGFHIVTPNKRANAQPYADYLELRTVSNSVGRRFLYETNVGAGLPVIDPLQNLMRTGDRILGFTGLLSGSLSYIFGRLDDGVAFSVAVQEAKQLGYLEPDPRDDLLCEDSIRKLTIIGREAGYPLNRDDITVTAVMPPGFDMSGGVPEFFERLPQADAYFEKKLAEARAEGKRLRFSAEIKDGRAGLQVVAVDPNNPLYEAKDSESLFAFYTERYKKRPLVIKGEGAGQAVTASGVFGDLLRLVSWNWVPGK